jgi:phosphohistidine phosphatase
MLLFLLRHAEAESEAASDEARVLTDKGMRQAVSVGKFCLAHGLVPEIILSSPLKRTEETARLVARELNLPNLVQMAEFLRSGMSAERALSGIREYLIGLMKREKYPAEASIMLVGHEPDFSTLAGVLIGGHSRSVHFRKAALLAISLQELKPGAGTIQFFVPVKLL